MKKKRPGPQTLAKAVGGLPLPPKIAKPPIPRVAKPLPASPPKPASMKPRASQASKPAATVDTRPSVAGKLGSFAPRKSR